MAYNLPPLEEPQQHGGWFMAFVRTWLEACFHPKGFFDAVGRGISMFEPLLFGVIVGWFSMVATSLMSLMGIVPMLGILGAIIGDQASALISAMSHAAMVVVYALFGWLFVLVGIAVSALFTHFFLIIVGGAREGFVATWRAIGYAWAPNIFSIVPGIGPLISAVYYIVLEVIGLAHVHRIEYWRSAIAVFLPMLLACCCGIALIGYLAALIAGVATLPE